MTCLPDQTVREIGDKFMDSPVPLLVVLDKDGNTVRGIITLHDLIRAQAAIRN
jgi:CBS domain-containing protein